MINRTTLKRFGVFLMVLYLIFKRTGWLDMLMEQKRRHKLLKQLPGPPLGPQYEHFLLGHAGSTKVLMKEGEKFSPELLSKVIVERLQEVSRKYRDTDDLFRIFALSSKIPTVFGAFVVVHNIETARELLSHKSMEDWHKGKAYDISESLIGDSILRAHGPNWAKQRPAMEKGMTHEVMESALPRVIQTANELCAKLEEIAKKSKNTQEVDISEEALKFTLDVIGRAAFSHTFGSVTAATTAEAPLYNSFQTILNVLNRRCQLPHEYLLSAFPTPMNIAYNKALGKLTTNVTGIINSRTTNKNDLLDVLMENRNTSKGLPDKLILDNVHTALFAGHDTTGAALTWMLRLLAVHPEVMKNVRKEILDKFSTDRDPTYQELESLDWLNAVVLETLRLYPSAAFTRSSDHDVSLSKGKYIIPAGLEVMVVPYIIHRDERYWENPNEFRPERFLNEELDRNSTDIRANSLQSRIGRISSKKAYLPFSLGPRNCVGRPLALMEMRVVLVKLLQKMSFSLPTKEDENFSEVPLFQLTLNPCGVRLIPVLES